MVDNLSVLKRSKVMASIRGKNTKPETIVRKLLWAEGKRYRIHDRSIFGLPDISNKRKRVAIFIDGCFWHGCDECYREPTTNVEYWRTKIQSNRRRRSLVKTRLLGEGWSVLEFWEHEVLAKPDTIALRVSCLL